MERYYLRFEAVNLGNFVYDTGDLSTIRGGSQLLSGAAKKVKTFTALKPLSTGASAALYEFDAPDDGGARDMRRRVHEKLLEDEMAQATFVVDVIRDPGDFGKARESLLALNRHRQMQAPSLVFPKLGSARVCRYDGVRPAVGEQIKQRDASHSVQVRRDYGRAEKQKILLDAAKELGMDLVPSDDFSDIAADPNRDFGNCANKLAVLYLDGNDFGAIQNKSCTSPEAQREFDSELRRRAKAAIRALLELAQGDQKRWFQGEILRLEVLMLAGDEIRLVVPAWCGWAALHELFRGITPKEPVLGHTLTWKAGLVFCHYHVPIQRLLERAGSLADFAKSSWKSRPMENVLCYEALESFDVPGELGSQKLPGTTAKDLVLRACDMEEIAGLVKTIRNHFPRNKAHQIVSLYERGDEQAAKALEDKEVGELHSEIQAAISGRSVLQGRAGWLHALQLADYAEMGRE
ncbi:MAG: hypothetical protein SGI92_01555 [Bryobacteraceae bacterium]|nr:hypothetical protein [Bryobacteraceae bacterium]